MIELITNTFSHSRAKGSAFVVRLALADYANEECQAFPSIGSLAKKTRLTERAVYAAIKDLHALGEVEINTRASKYRSNLYTLKFIQDEHPSGSEEGVVMRSKGAQQQKRATRMKQKLLDEHPDIQTKEIIAEWNRYPHLCPFTPEDLQEDQRQQMLRHIYEHPSREWWRDSFFKVVGTSRSFKGEKWTATLPWAMMPRNFKKIVTGFYAISLKRMPI